MLAPQRKMLERNGRPADPAQDEKMRRLYRKHLSEIKQWLAGARAAAAGRGGRATARGPGYSAGIRCYAPLRRPAMTPKHPAAAGMAAILPFVLVGGSSAIPLVHEIVGAAFDCPTFTPTKPMLAVARGAAEIARTRLPVPIVVPRWTLEIIAGPDEGRRFELPPEPLLRLLTPPQLILRLLRARQ